MPERGYDTYEPMMWHRLRRILPWLLMLGFWVWCYGPGLWESIRYALEREVMCDDVRIVHFHFFHWMDPELFANDVLGKYHADGTGELFRGLFYLAAKFGDPYEFTKLPPYALFLVTLLGVGWAAHHLGGKNATFVAITLCLGSTILLERMVGTLPRAFAFPIVAWMAAALAGGRVRLLACLTVLGSGFYPVVTVIGGLCLAMVLLVEPAEDRGCAREWTLSRRLTWLVLTALACGALTLPFTLRMKPYGEAITAERISEFPEAGPGGRQDALTRPPFAPLVTSWTDVARDTVLAKGPRLVPWVGKPLEEDRGLRDVWLDLLTYLALLGCALLGFRSNRAVRRVAVLPVAIGVGYLLANAVSPRLVVPPRYTLYGVPIVTVLAVAAAPVGFGSWCSSHFRFSPRLRGIGAFVLASLVLALFGGQSRVKAGIARYNAPVDRPLLQAVAELPKSVLIAGWPEGVLETLPVLSRRTPFLTRELHVPYHTEMTLQMRERMKALIDAYYASDVAPLRRLRDEFGVTHLLVEPTRLQRPSRYFAPFGPDIARAHQKGRSKGFLVERLRDAAIYADKKYFILELEGLTEP